MRVLPSLIRPFSELTARLISLGLYAATQSAPFPGWKTSADRFGVSPRTVETYVEQMAGLNPATRSTAMATLSRKLDDEDRRYARRITRSTMWARLSLAWLLVLGCIAAPMKAAAPEVPDATGAFAQTVQPFLKTYCTSCHSGAKPAAELDLGQYATVDSVVQDFSRWNRVLARLSAREMPPRQATQPPDRARQQVIDWIQTTWATEARRRDGDPGVVLARRLSNAEYDYTIRDLTGVDIRPAREFPVDPANQAGFDNSGESLAMSPALLNKYLLAARNVADHMFLNAQGFDFAPHPMLVETDRDRYMHPADRRLLRSSEHRLRRLLQRRVDLQTSRRARHAQTRRSPTSPGG